MDKIATKRLLRGTEVKLPEDTVWHRGEPAPKELTFPVVTKTPNGGSTIGIHICDDAVRLEEALTDCAQYEADVLIEQFNQPVFCAD